MAEQKNPGWQQPAVPHKPNPCAHIGVLFANMTAFMHAEGHEWVCSCGKVFVVVSNGGRDKRLVPDWKKDRDG